jgi:hypothetical protein
VKRVAWLTDLHLNFVEPEARAAFYAAVLAEHPDAVLISGDLGEGPSLDGFLAELDNSLGCPVHFVLGNHDFYRSSFAAVRPAAEARCRQSRHLTYLTGAGVVELTPGTGLIGHDGWADGRLGDFWGSEVFLNDYLIIQELFGGEHQWDNKQVLYPKLNALGDAAAAYFRQVLPEALARYPRVIAVTHVPPFKEACWYNGKPSDDHWLPHFSCQAAGEALCEVMRAHPDRQLLVLCGHTHGQGEAQILDNLKVLTGGAKYGAPQVQRILEVA